MIVFSHAMSLLRNIASEMRTRAAGPVSLENPLSGPRNHLYASAIVLRLVGDAGMMGAIGAGAHTFRGPAKSKFRRAWVADRPVAHRLAEIHDRHRLGEGHHDILGYGGDRLLHRGGADRENRIAVDDRDAL
jgi:hypothetical protein